MMKAHLDSQHFLSPNARSRYGCTRTTSSSTTSKSHREYSSTRIPTSPLILDDYCDPFNLIINDNSKAAQLSHNNPQY